MTRKEIQEVKTALLDIYNSMELDMGGLRAKIEMNAKDLQLIGFTDDVVENMEDYDMVLTKIRFEFHKRDQEIEA